MKKHYDLLILGATVLGAGIAAANSDKSIVMLESVSTCAGEFSAACKGGSAHACVPATDAARALREDCTARGMLTDSGEWLPAISPIIADIWKKSSADCYFFAALADISVCDAGYAVTFSAFGMRHGFTVGAIVDTTSRFVSHAYFNEPSPEMRGISLNWFDRELSLHAFPCGDDIAAARLALTAEQEGFFRLATELCLTPAETERRLSSAMWAPSAAYDNFLAAFDAGAKLALPEPGAAACVKPDEVYAGSWDVIVVGLGTAGAAAAVTAAESGLRVLGLESLSVGGGAGTAGGILGYYFGFKGGVYRTLDADAAAKNGKFVRTGGVGADQKIVAIDERLKNADVRYGVMFDTVLCEGSRVTGVRFIEDGVAHVATAKFVIDCSADSAACVSAGCEMQGGRESDGHFQPYSSVFMRNSKGALGYAYVDNGRVNQYDPDDFGEHVLRSSTSYVHLRDDYSAHDYLGIAPLIGLREGLRIVGEENVAFEQIIAGGWHHTPVYYGWSNLDNHGKDNVLEDRIYQDWNTICGMWGWGMALPIPRGALIPRGYDGILAAGRNVAVDHNVAMGVRMKDDVQKSGEAAARIAALAIRDGIPAKNVDLSELRGQLFASGCLKPEDRLMIEKQRCDEVHEWPLWCGDDEQIAAGLATDAPAYFMWSAKHFAKAELLTSLLDADCENTRTNAALTLSLLDVRTEKSVEILLASAVKRDGYIAKAGRKYIVPRSIASIYALGRIAAAEAIPALLAMLDDDSFVDELPFEPYDLIADRADYHFQYRSNVIAALCSIAAAHPDERDAIKSRLLAYVETAELTVTMMGPRIRHDCSAALMDMVKKI